MCKHVGDEKKLGYVAWHAESEKLHRKGQRQIRCGECLRYFWPHEYKPGEKKRT